MSLTLVVCSTHSPVGKPLPLAASTLTLAVCSTRSSYEPCFEGSCSLASVPGAKERPVHPSKQRTKSCPSIAPRSTVHGSPLLPWGLADFGLGSTHATRPRQCRSGVPGRHCFASSP
eukprot:1192641-Prorocentrum_minimum.AAC.2